MELSTSKIKKFLIFQEMELSGSNIKKFLIFSQKKAFLIFQEMELFYILGNGNPRKIPYILENGNPEKIIYISGNETFLQFRKQNFQIFQERYILKPGIYRT